MSNARIRTIALPKGPGGNIRALLFLAAPLAFAALAVLFGKGTGWDLENYHWYNPYALLHGRLGFDVAVAHIATYYNPVADLPLYWIGNHAPAWVTGAVLGALYGLVVALIGASTWELQLSTNGTARLAGAAIIALAGALGGGALPMLGDVANDVPVALGIVTALWILLRGFDALQSTAVTASFTETLLLAGFCAGLSVGFKLTMGVYAAGLLLAILVVPSTLKTRGAGFVLLGIGMAAGFALCSGVWLWRMWRYSGNPLFPYFNHLFHSSLAQDTAYRDTTFINDSLGTQLVFPWLFTLDSKRAAEWVFRDAHILAAYVLVPLGALALLLWRRREARAHAWAGPAAAAGAAASGEAGSQQARPDARRVLFLFCFAAATYFAWLKMFSIYRYLIPLEMLAPLLIALALLQLPVSMRLRVAAIAVVLVALQLAVKITLERDRWDRSYVSVQVPAIADSADSMVLLAGNAPMAYVIPSFPAAMPFLRIDGWLVPLEDRSSGLALQMHARVAAYRGGFYLLFMGYERQRASDAAEAYGLQLTDQCQSVRSNIAATLTLCALRRT